MTTQTLEQPVGMDLGDLDLDVRIVESGDVVNVLLANTDDRCDTQKNGDC